MISILVLLAWTGLSHAQQPDKDTIPDKKKRFEYLLFQPKSDKTYPDSIPELDTIFLYEFYDMSLEELDSVKALGVSSELERTSGRFFNLTTEEEPAPPALDRDVAEKLWILSYELGGFNYEGK